ncbi:MAG: putative lipid II flippase FtsW [Oscillospiraceae bacterium]|nr:putative lipid II flippase FtsW [Oscillospiraceae bacterium]
MQKDKRKNERGTSSPRGTSSAKARSMPPVSPAKTAKPVGYSVNPSIPQRPTPDFTNAGGVGVAVAGSAVRKSAAVKPRAAKPVKVKKQRERLAKFDYPFFTIVIVLMAFGIVMMFSASYATSFRRFGDSYYYVYRQLAFIGLGLVAMLILSVTDYHVMLNKHIIKIGVIILAALMLLVTFAGTGQAGAGRWLEFGGISIQPSEILKFALIVIFAYLAHTKHARIKEFKHGFLPFMVVLLTACGLMFAQRHLSGTIIIFAIGLIMMFVGDCKVSHIVVMVLSFAVLGALGLMAMKAIGYDYFTERIIGWQNPEADIRGFTFQTYQSLITIGSGGFFGLGLGNSRQKYSYLPESHNDFIFSIICEELGFVGAVLVILLFVLFVFRGFYIAVRARDKFGMMLAVGITSHLGIQALLNIGVVTNSLPNTGISLPFFSYGGSALVMQLAEIGVVLNISRKAAIE